MNTHENKNQKNQTQSISNEVTENQITNSSTSYFIDNRPESFIENKMQGMANDFIASQPTIQKKKNNTGLPDNLKSGIENLSGHSMDDVKVHYNSPKPSQLQAHAYSQGTDIHIASRQEKHLPHEAWHVVQQKQGRVKPTMQLKEKVSINDDKSLEKEADIMGTKASQLKPLQKREMKTGIITEKNTLQLKPLDIQDGKKIWTVEVVKIDTGYNYKIDLPPMFPPSLVSIIEDKLGFPRESLLIRYDSTKEPLDNKLNNTKVRIAKEAISDYISSLGLNRFAKNLQEKLLKILDQQSVGFFKGFQWRQYMGQILKFGEDHQRTEGLTTGPGFKPAKRGKRNVGINADNHSVGTIVHELLHSLAADSMAKLPHDVDEALTEWFALRASGLSFRIGRSGEKIYHDLVKVVDLAIECGKITKTDLVNAFLLGDSNAISVLIDGFEQYTIYKVQLTEYNDQLTKHITSYGKHDKPLVKIDPFEEMKKFWK